ncbi:unnamed protein product [Periconia digitata]|uniref:Uncharacterized protein n=1 Tax=Periconia digitata TaxID=1303443 RepID=A0A9W4U3D3_9PLEO|nr:unnamed protein product [Periconia digitata]
MRSWTLLCGVVLAGRSQAGFDAEFQRPKVDYRRVNSTTALSSSIASGATTSLSSKPTSSSLSSSSSTKTSISSSSAVSNTESKAVTSVDAEQSNLPQRIQTTRPEATRNSSIVSIQTTSAGDSSVLSIQTTSFRPEAAGNSSVLSIRTTSIRPGATRNGTITTAIVPSTKSRPPFALISGNGTCTGCNLDVLRSRTTTGPSWSSYVVTETILNKTIHYYTGEPPVLQTTEVVQEILSQTKTVVFAGNQTVSHGAPTFKIVPTDGVTLYREVGPVYVIYQAMEGGLNSPHTAESGALISQTACSPQASPLAYATPTRTEDWDFFIETFTGRPTAGPKNKGIPPRLLGYLKQNPQLQEQFAGHDIATCTAPAEAPTESFPIDEEPATSTSPSSVSAPSQSGSVVAPGEPAPSESSGGDTAPDPTESVGDEEPTSTGSSATATGTGVANPPNQGLPSKGNPPRPPKPSKPAPTQSAFFPKTSDKPASTYLSTTFEYTTTHTTVQGCLRCDSDAPSPTDPAQNQRGRPDVEPDLAPEPVTIPPAPSTTFSFFPPVPSPPPANTIKIGDETFDVRPVDTPQFKPVQPPSNPDNPFIVNGPNTLPSDSSQPISQPPTGPGIPVPNNPALPPANPGRPNDPAQPNVQPPVQPAPNPNNPTIPNAPPPPADPSQGNPSQPLPQAGSNPSNQPVPAGPDAGSNILNLPVQTGAQTGQNPPNQLLRPAPQTSLGSQPNQAPNFSGDVVIGSQTLSAGQTTIMNGATVIVPTSGGGSQLIVDGATHTITPTPPMITEKATISLGGDKIPASVIGGTPVFVLGPSDTLTLGGVATVSGTTYSLPASGSGSVVVANGATSTLSAASPALTVGGPSQISASVKDGTTAFVVAPGQTLAPGSVVTVSGTTFSMPTEASGSVLVVNGATSTIAGSSPVLTLGGPSQISASVNDGTTAFVIAPGQTLAPGSEVTISGTTYSMPSTASGSVLVVNGASSTIAGGSPVLTLGGTSSITASVKDGTNAFVVAPGQTLAPGSEVIISGTTYSMPSTASGSVLVVNGASSTLSAALPVLTIGGEQNVISATVKDGTTVFAIAPGQTLAPGSAITVSGTTYSMPATASGSVLVVNGRTSTLEQPLPIMTLPNGVPVSASMIGGVTAFVIGAGQTLTPGGNVTVSGTIYSMPATRSGGGFDVVVYGQASTYSPTRASVSASTTGARDSGGDNAGGAANKVASSTPSTGGGSSLSQAGFDRWVESILLSVAGWMIFLI